MLLLHGHPLGFGLTGVVIPKRPPCFAIPFFEPHEWFLFKPPNHFPRIVFIQDVCSSQVMTFARFELDETAKTISAKHIKTLSVDSGDYDLPSYERHKYVTPLFLAGLHRLYAFAESPQVVRVGYMEPLRQRLSKLTSLPFNDESRSAYKNNDSEGIQFTMLELARFQRNRSLCLNALKACFGSLEQHNRGLAVHWLEMTKDSLKSEGILESTD